MARKRKQRKEAEKLAKRAGELKEQAKEFAGEGGEAFKEFAHTTGGAAKEFANTAFEAAKDLLETVEKAGERLNGETKKPKRRRGRKVLKTGLVVGVGVAVFTNEKVRGAITGAVRRVTGGDQPEPWTPASAAGDEFARTGTEAP